MEGSSDWAGLVVDILESISGRLTDPTDFVRFRAVCPQWRDSIPVTHARFSPWILKSEEIGNSGDIQFYSLESGKLQNMHVPALEGKRTRLAGFGAGLLIGVDSEDELSAVLANPLTGDTSTLPRLPEWCLNCHTNGFVTDPKVTGEKDVFVVIYGYRWPVGDERLGHIALWRLGDADGWATIPSQRFWPMMPQYMSRLSKHGPRMLEEKMATVAAGCGKNGLTNGGKALIPVMESAYLMENKDRVRFLSQHWMFTDTAHLPQPQDAPVSPGDLIPGLTFELRDTLDADGDAIDWADAPELHGKVIFQSQDTGCYVLPASDRFADMKGNFVYFLSWQRQEEVDGDGAVGDGNAFGYFLCKWDMIRRFATVVEKVPGAWDQHKPGMWFMPTFKY
ncbi:hypothetical protein HU200_050250 [Digitaria exilis]|uniref:KIB1-4 beta-propeller domain-containing protein n=1 Tax=Digitaria exilis TaxID=1010633 RepID=A0A835ARW9_9POAL|nr:hypothetical protein HU200_050250 [Digitaria exilis]